ncbi:hypothetical protein EMIHUDRAFT_229293 [Emiliania huxleyi CCMP1516]|uniref:Rieske domain-containing protein n=2 Tax=Emiliania huxleyi TaxID=2903 RepID=A0A0D3KDF0_EMIH1|nr:hypothetical protein EMIHUDRAFT_229293 [Emiliania huxleyi CCMP1516]EOD33785.1 hypothetical protein EMIHUDRAFT_229293 [Emiliania huxleyi CCMP1516]|eukprot:XP_005786214.1 hypothetical protein EMIHUDRAFT_229293 [Emiliania huxleyi CCMP1516]
MLLLAAGALAAGGLTGGTHARTLTSAQRYAAFDWMAHWYPMAWTRDLPVDRPTRVTLFDDDYAVVLRSDGQPPLALRDVCPHRLAALSEGRLTEQGFLQCAYHGWAFDDSGACKAIPQLPAGGSLASACTRAATAVVSQGILWLHPAPRGTAPLPEVPRVPEMDDERYKWSPAVRDLPIDYSLLVENILDPDHGLFAHQLPAFDLYSASPDAPQRVTVRAVEDEAEDEAAAFAIESRVAAWAKLTRRQAESAGSTAVRTAYAAASADTPQLEASSTFRPPAVIVSCRRDGAGASSFLTCFFLSPTGVGRTRFMAAGVGRGLPVALPRWLQHVGLNNFLDQDTLLLATQQPHVLRAELERRHSSSYRSPTEKMLLEAQHTRVCPDSSSLVARLRMARNAAWALALAAVGRASAGGPLLSRGAVSAVLLAAAGWVAHALRREFTFCYPERKRDADLRKVPRVFADERLLRREAV